MGLLVTFMGSGVNGPPDLVSSTIVSLPDGCELTLTHKVAAEYGEYVEGARKAWSGMLEDLASQLEAIG